jgi:hypothetical protein
VFLIVPSSISDVTDHHPTSIPAATVICPLAGHQRSAGSDRPQRRNQARGCPENRRSGRGAGVASPLLPDTCVVVVLCDLDVEPGPVAVALLPLSQAPFGVINEIGVDAPYRVFGALSRSASGTTGSTGRCAKIRLTCAREHE